MNLLGADQLRVIPAGLPWQKAGLLQASPQQRAEMAALAFQGQPFQVVVDTQEIDRAAQGQPTYTIDTLRADTLLPHLQLNLAGPMALTAALLRGTAAWNAQRRVLAISSGAARNPVPGWSAYCAGKAGLDMFIRSVNAEYGNLPEERAVRAVALAPGVVDTGMQETIRGADFAQVQRFRDLKANDQLASPDDVAQRIVTYLGRADFGKTELDDIRNH